MHVPFWWQCLLYSNHLLTMHTPSALILNACANMVAVSFIQQPSINNTYYKCIVYEMRVPFCYTAIQQPSIKNT